jgi:hypothetical protein
VHGSCNPANGAGLLRSKVWAQAWWESCMRPRTAFCMQIALVQGLDLCGDRDIQPTNDDELLFGNMVSGWTFWGLHSCAG